MSAPAATASLRPRPSSAVGRASASGRRHREGNLGTGSVNKPRIPYARVLCDGREKDYVEEVLESGWLTTA